tara:strand:+ start:246 stop:548 length:303 start_codon:yes stop_codon:yes gene_type:complete
MILTPPQLLLGSSGGGAAAAAASRATTTLTMMSGGPDDEQSVSPPLTAALLCAALAIGFQSIDRASSVALAGQGTDEGVGRAAFRAAELLAAVVGWLGLS